MLCPNEVCNDHFLLLVKVLEDIGSGHYDGKETRTKNKIL